MHKTRLKGTSINTALLLAGCVIYAVGIGLFLDPNGLCPAGVSGLAIAVNKWIEFLCGGTPLSTGAIIAVFNVPIMILGIVKLGRKFFISTIFATLASSALIDLFENFIPIPTNELLLASVLGGAFMSLGMGLVFRAGATTGGTDVIVRVLRNSKKYKHIKTGQMFWFFDGTVVLIYALTMRDVAVLLYAIMTLAVQTFVLDAVLYGVDSAKLLFIVSDKQKEICTYLLEDIDTGVTMINGTGAYTGKDKQVIMCVVKKHVLPKVRDFVSGVDPKAFIIISKATEIYGEGYKDHKSEEI